MNGGPKGREIKNIFRNVNVRTIIHQGSTGTQKEHTYPQRENQSHFQDTSIPVF